MRSAYRVLALLIVAGVFLQAASITFGVFHIFHAIDGGAVIDKSYEVHEQHPGIAMHGIVGLGLIPLLALVFLIVSFFAKIPGGVKWAAFVLLAIIVQIALVFASFGAPILGALHGMNALVIIGLSFAAARRAKATEAVVASDDAVGVTTV